MTPAVRLKPAGRVPTVSAHVYGAVPPVAARVTGPYAVPNVAAASGEVVVILNATPAAFTVIERAFVTVPAAASVTVILALTVPTADGVPEMTPAELRAKPVGSALPPATVQV
jgi:hypothetical protein